MSDIVIRNMEMPKSCIDGKGIKDCPFVGVCQIYKNTPYSQKKDKFLEQRLEGCPLVELPPHGDLIDRSELSTISITDYKFEGHLVVEIEDIENAPTILEASKEEKKK